MRDDLLAGGGGGGEKRRRGKGRVRGQGEARTSVGKRIRGGGVPGRRELRGEEVRVVKGQEVTCKGGGGECGGREIRGK